MKIILVFNKAYINLKQSGDAKSRFEIKGEPNTPENL